MFLVELKLENRPLWKRNRLFGHKNRLARLVASPRSRIDAPGSLLLAVDSMRHRTVGALFIGAVVEFCLQRFPLIRKVGGRLNELHGDLIGRIFWIRGGDLELAERGHAADGPSGPLAGQIGIGQLLETERRNGGEPIRSPEVGCPLSGGITGSTNRPVFILIEPLPSFSDMLAMNDRPLRLIAPHRCFPGCHANLPVRRGVAKNLLLFPDLPRQLVTLELLRRAVGHDGRFVIVVQEGKEAVVLLLRNGIVFVVMALGTLNGNAEHRLADAVHSINETIDAKLLGICPALFIQHRIAQEPSGHAAGIGRLRQQVASDLLDEKLVIGQVAIEGVDHPISVRPDKPGLVLFETIGVGIASRIQPMSSPAFSVMRGG